MSGSHGPGPDSTLKPDPALKQEVRLGFLRGFRSGIRGFLWSLKIIVPVSLAVALLDWTGWLYALDPVFRPVMALIHLPPQAALPILTGIFTSFYAAVAMMVTIPFSHAQFILMSIFVCVAHMLVVEGVIQHKSGIHIAAITSIRFVTACVAVYVASLFFTGTEIPVVMPEAFGQHVPLSNALLAWGMSTADLLLKLFAIIVSVMIVLEILKVLGYTDRIARVFRPFMAVLGLTPNVATMWVTGAFFGLVYGSAVIVEECTSGRFSEDELIRLHISLGVGHSLVEDPALFLALGVGLQWTLLPRLLSAAGAVHVYRLIRAIKTRLHSPAAKPSR